MKALKIFIFLVLIYLPATLEVSHPDEESEIHQQVTGDSRTISAICLAAIMLMIAAGGGIGGGGILVPTYIFILGFMPKTAIPLSNCTILGGSISNILLNYNKKHPYADRFLIDWDILLVMEPVTIAGGMLGSMLNVLTPDWLLCIMLVVLLTTTAYRTGRKGIKKFQQENAILAGQNMTCADFAPLKAGAAPITIRGKSPKHRENTSPAAIIGYDAIKTHVVQNDTVHFAKEIQVYNKQQIKMIIDEESKHPFSKIGVMIFVSLGVFTFNLLKGGPQLNVLDVTCGSSTFWVLTIAVIPFVFVVSYFARRYLVARYVLKQRIGYKYAHGDVEWNELNTIIYPSVCCVAGICAGLFGVGGGIVKGPLMLEMNVLPEVASATSATMILFTSLSATVTYAMFGVLNYNYAVVLFAIGVFFTAIGQIMVNRAVKKSGRSSFIILSIAVIVAMSAIAMGIQSSSSLVDLFRGHEQRLKKFCA